MSHQHVGHNYRDGPRFKVLYERLEKLMISLAAPGLVVQWAVDCTAVAPQSESVYSNVNSTLLHPERPKLYGVLAVVGAKE